MGPISITFSQTKDLHNLTVTFLLDTAQTSVTSESWPHTVTKNEPSGLKLQKLNDLYINFAETEINLNDEVILNGEFEHLNFIAFASDDRASWIVHKSKIQDQSQNTMVTVIISTTKAYIILQNTKCLSQSQASSN